uniref:DUF834 domain-containing protein n=1 Tax=Oryza nivara TaxID=4536 RepID=A0A0E0HAU3_ORYNI
MNGDGAVTVGTTSAGRLAAAVNFGNDDDAGWGWRRLWPLRMAMGKGMLNGTGASAPNGEDLGSGGDWGRLRPRRMGMGKTSAPVTRMGVGKTSAPTGAVVESSGERGRPRLPRRLENSAPARAAVEGSGGSRRSEEECHRWG